MSAIEIPGYKIVRTLGVGGQATVYLAIQQGFDREVALKVMSPALAADPSFGERFIREAKIVAKLSHARIVTVYDVGESGSFYYLAMEYMRGQELKTRIAKGLKAKEALIIIAKLAQALHFAHKKGYVHRDVKSENILFDDNEQPVLTDFGIAKASNSSTQMTQTGKLIGTPEYMSPEQCRGRKLDGRSDLYSLGIILYEMMTRKVPFTGEDSVSVCIQHVTKPVPQLPARLNHFQWLIDGLLDKKPQGRFQTGQELAIAIKEYLSNGQESKIVKKAAVKPVTSKVNNQVGRREDFSDESFELNDNFQVDQRINVLPETKSRVPLITTVFVLLIAIGGGYAMRASWLPKVKVLLGLESTQPKTTQTDNQTGLNKKANASQLTTNRKNGKTQTDTNNKNNGQSSDAVVQKKLAEDERVGQLIQQADTLAQYSPHELTDIQQALDVLTTAKSLAPGNENITRIKNNVIVIALEEAKSSAKNEQFDIAYNWLQLVESADRDNRQLDSTKRIVADYKRTYDSLVSQRQQTTKQLNDFIQSAELALSENRLGNPESHNAIYYFESALELDPNNIQAKRGLNIITEKYLALIDKAVKENKFQKARSYLAKAKTISFAERDFLEIEGQVSAAKRLFSKRLKEKQRQQAIVAEKKQIEQKRQDKLADPLVQMRLQSILDTAKNLLGQGSLVEPVGNNALDKYKAALEIDDKEPLAIEAIKCIEKTIVDNIDVALSNHLESPARQWLAKLQIFDPEHSQIENYLIKIEELVVAEQMNLQESVSQETILPETILQETISQDPEQSQEQEQETTENNTTLEESGQAEATKLDQPAVDSSDGSSQATEKRLSDEQLQNEQKNDEQKNEEEGNDEKQQPQL